MKVDAQSLSQAGAYYNRMRSVFGSRKEVSAVTGISAYSLKKVEAGRSDVGLDVVIGLVASYAERYDMAPSVPTADLIALMLNNRAMVEDLLDRIDEYQETRRAGRHPSGSGCLSLHDGLWYLKCKRGGKYSYTKLLRPDGLPARNRREAREAASALSDKKEPNAEVPFEQMLQIQQIASLLTDKE